MKEERRDLKQAVEVGEAIYACLGAVGANDIPWSDLKTLILNILSVNPDFLLINNFSIN